MLTQASDVLKISNESRETLLKGDERLIENEINKISSEINNAAQLGKTNLSYTMLPQNYYSFTEAVTSVIKQLGEAGYMVGTTGLLNSEGTVLDISWNVQSTSSGLG